MKHVPRGKPIRIQTADHVTLAADYWPARCDRGLVLAHGLFCDRTLPEIRQLARDLSRDFHVLTFNFRGMHDSHGRFTFGIDEWLDVQAAVEHLRTRDVR